jgi:sialic acid synthase SpsE
LRRSDGGPDAAFSLEPAEFKAMVDSVRVAEKAFGRVNYEVTEKEKASRVFRRSLFVVSDLKQGDVLTQENVRSIRPGYGLAPKFLDSVLGRRVNRDLAKGTPLKWEVLNADPCPVVAGVTRRRHRGSDRP